MKNNNLSSTFTVLPRNKSPNKEKFNVLNKYKKTEEKSRYVGNNSNINNLGNKRKQYNSAMHINNNFNNNIRNINNIDNNISYSNFPNKELLSNASVNNMEDMDEKLDIRLPYNINNNINQTVIRTQGNKMINYNIYHANNIKDGLFSNNETDIYNSTLNTNIKNNNEISDSNNPDSYNDKYFNTFSQLKSINKGNKLFHAFQNGNENKNKYLLPNGYNETRNITIERNLIVNRKKYNNLEEKEIDNLINKNNYFLNKNRNIVKSYLINNYNGTFENDFMNRQNNKYMARGPSGIYQNENKDILNFSNNNKKKFSVTKKDLKQFNKNEHYIQKIIDNLPQSKNKKIKNNFNYDYRKHVNENNLFYSKLNNKDNNVDYFYNNYNNKISYNNYLKKDSNNNINNSNSMLNNGNNINNNIKTVRASKYLSVGRGKTFINSNNNNENSKYENKKASYIHQTISSAYKYNHTTKRSFNEAKNRKYNVDSPYIFAKKKYFTEFIFHVFNRKFKHLFINFLDIKSILNLSCANRQFFKNTKDSIYEYIYGRLLKDKNKEKYINYVLNSAKKCCSDIIKSKKANEMKNFFEKLSKKNEIYDDIILKDLPRTIPNDISFNIGHPNYDKLYKILTCYSNFNKKIGYAQGLNFISAQAIYLFSSEEEVFKFFEGFINIMKMDNFIGVGNEKKMLAKLNEFSKILYRYVPKIIQFFNEKSVSHDFFSTGWILTLFSTSMERNCLVILWCFMIIFRWKFVYAFIIQILKRYEREIINVTEGQLCFKMKNLLRHREFKNDFDVIIEDTLKFMKNNIVL